MVITEVFKGSLIQTQTPRAPNSLSCECKGQCARRPYTDWGHLNTFALGDGSILRSLVVLLPCQVCWISLGASSTTLECIHVLLNKDPVVSTQTSQELPEGGVRAAPSPGSSQGQ